MYIESNIIDVYPNSRRLQKYNSNLFTEYRLLEPYKNILNYSNYCLQNGLIFEDSKFKVNAGIYIIKGYKITIDNAVDLTSLLQNNKINYIYLTLTKLNSNILNGIDIYETPTSESLIYNGITIDVLTNKDNRENSIYLGYVCTIGSSFLYNNEAIDLKLNAQNNFSINIKDSLNDIANNIEGEISLPFKTWVEDNLIFDDKNI